MVNHSNSVDFELNEYDEFRESTKSIRYLIYLYLLLWLFEGALRKWVFPGLATPLLVVRDPVVIAIYWLAYTRGYFSLNGFVSVGFVLTGLAFVSGIVFGHGNILVAAYGFRVFFLHLPLIFVFGNVLTREDVIIIAKWTLVVAIPMTLLLILQYQSSPSAWVNRGIGGHGSAVFTGALGKYRPPGTWSFIIGPTIFYPLATACWFGLYLRGRLPLWLMLSSGAAIFLACPVSVSRGMVLGVVLVSIVGLLALIRHGVANPQKIFQSAGALIAVLALGMLHPEFREASSAFGARWDNATVRGGGFGETVVMRVVRQFTSPLSSFWEAPVMGHGLGIGTNAGAKIIYGKREFSMGEGEWERIVNELGPFIGGGMILLRFCLASYLVALAYGAWQRGDEMAMLFLSACFFGILNGQWSQPTALGGAIIGAGLLWAGGNDFEEQSLPEEGGGYL